MFSRLALFLLPLFAATSATISDCGASTSLFQITELSMDPPDTVSAGQNVSLALKYTAPVEVDGGLILTALSLNGLPFPASDSDLCASAACPITVGDHDGSSWSLFPSGFSGKVQTTITWKDNITGQVLLCIKAILRTAASDDSWFSSSSTSSITRKIRGQG